MNNLEITAEQSRAARSALGVSQAFVARETGINRSQLALFEVGKYRLEPYKLLALRHCYEQLGYHLDEVLPTPVQAPSVQEPTPASRAANPVGAPAKAGKVGTQPLTVDGLLVRGDLAKDKIDTISKEIDANDEQIKSLAEAPVKLHWWDDKPITDERDAIIRRMARNYLLMRSLQGREMLPQSNQGIGKGGAPAPKTAGDLAAALLVNPVQTDQGT